jgi:hypothetical protein
MSLLTSKKNELFDTILEQGFSPNSFIFHETTKKNEVTLAMKDSKYFFRFVFEVSSNTLYIRAVVFSPGEHTPVENHAGYAQWGWVTESLLTWLNYLRREIEEPDKWKQVFEAGKRISWESDEEDNKQFTFEEVKDIERSIELAKKQLEKLGLQNEQLKTLEKKLDYVADKAKTLGKVDWKNLFVGTMIGFIVQAAIPPETAKSIWLILQEAFRKILLIALH